MLLRALVVALSCLPARAADAPPADAYFVFGLHGGYYLTSESEYQRCLDTIFGLLEADPKFKVVLELEPYTLEAMQHGERFDVERHGRTQPVLAGWQLSPSGVERLREAAHDGDYGMRLSRQGPGYANLCQSLAGVDLRGHALTLSGWVRARRGERVHLYLDAWSAQSFIAGSAVMAIAPADGQWHHLSLRFVVPNDAQTIFPQAKVDGDGEGDFDGLSLQDAGGEELLANGGFETSTVPELRDEPRLAQLRKWCATGRLEIVGGAYTQPIIYTIGDESAARQFAFGTRGVREALGLPVRVYAAQEPGMCGQFPQLARAAGIADVLYRTHWCLFGSPPPRDVQTVWWVGPDGTRLPAVPAYTFTPITGYGLPGWPTEGYLAAARTAKVEQPLFTMFGDLVSAAIPEETSMLTSGRLMSGWAHLCRAMPAQDLAGRRLVFSAELRSTKPGAHLYWDAHAASDAPVGGVQSRNVPPDGKWHRAEVSVTVPAGAVTMFPQARIIPPDGELEVAEVSLVTEDGRQLLPDPLVQDGKPGTGWGAGGSEDVKVETTAGEAEGRQRVRLVVHASGLRADITTLAEYFQRAGEPKTSWPDAYDGFEHRFPWGLLAGRPQREDRLAEDAVVGAERLLALEGRRAAPELEAAWRLVLMQEHHDGWVCAPVLFGVWRGYDSYAAMCAAASQEARRRCAQLTAPLTASHPGRDLQVINLAGHARTEVVRFQAELPPGAATNPVVTGPKGQAVAGEVAVASRHADGSARRVSGRFLASAPAMGSALYRLGKSEAPRSLPQPPLTVTAAAEGLFGVSGGDGRPLLRGPVRLTGRFAAGELWDRRAPGAPSEAAEGLRTSGEVGGVKYECTVDPSPASPLVHLTLKLDYGPGTDVGATEDSDRLPKWAKTDQKLRLVIPLPYSKPRFLVHGPFEVRAVPAGRSNCVRYAIAQGDEAGVALFTDRATDVVFRVDPAALELTLAYGGGFIYAPGEHSSLTGREEYDLALLCYRGDWAAARVPEVADDLAHPLMVVPGAEAGAASSSRLALQPEGTAVVTAFFATAEGEGVRLWRPYPGEADVQVRVSGARGLFRADLAGEPQQRVAEGETASLHLRHNEIVTLAAAR